MAFWTETEKEKFQLRGSDNLFDDFLLYANVKYFVRKR